MRMEIALDGLNGSHDLRLSAWGPYTKRYIGISHIPDPAAGLRFDLSVFPALYRRRVEPPNVMWESGYHPWEAAPDLSYYRHRHELLWKDQLYCDIDFCRLDAGAALIAVDCVNASDEPQNVALHDMASLNFPPLRPYSREPLRPAQVKLPDGGMWVNGLAYETFERGERTPQDMLPPDGQRRGMLAGHGFVDGEALAFGRAPGGCARYAIQVAAALKAAALVLRVRAAGGGRVQLSGLAETSLDLAASETLATATVALGALRAGSHTLAIRVEAGADLVLDGFAIVPADTAAAVTFETAPLQPRPTIEQLPGRRALMLQYEAVAARYGIAWGGETWEVREFECDDLDTTLRHTVHNHVSRVIQGEGRGHFTNVFIRPIFLKPGETRTLYGLVCTGTADAVRRRLEAFDPDAPICAQQRQQARARAASLAGNAAGAAYRFSQERMAATTLAGIVYPVRTRGQWIRHYSPGRWWDCLYTWDSGFLGLGLAELDVDRAIDNLNAYMTPEDDDQAAFIHHGTPLPTQIYLLFELWQKTRSRALLEYAFPRARQYHRFLAGRLGGSTTARLRSGMLTTWDYFYNSGGWDDYPPQAHVHGQHLTATVAPCANTAHAIRTARLLAMMGTALGADVREFEEDIARFTRALQNHAWDPKAGYFSYVTHDASGQAVGILRHDSGANFNMGLDGATPLIAGACDAKQEALLVERLMTDGRMWCRYGLSTVDQQAPYYRDDGYWNGAVWLPHQWFYWKTLLDLGLGEQAFRIAATALELWQTEVGRSYNCFEHFLVKTGRGAGWHHFTGLSCPVLAWYGAYYRPGRLTVGFDLWIESCEAAKDGRSLRATLRGHGAARHQPVVVACLAQGPKYAATWNGAAIEAVERVPGAIEVRLPSGNAIGELVVTAR